MNEYHVNEVLLFVNDCALLILLLWSGYVWFWLAGWLAVWLHAFISSCYFMFNHLYICNWVWEFAFGSVYSLMQSGVTARHVCQAISRSIGKGILCNIMPSYHFYAMIYHDLLCCTFAPGCVLRFLCVMITWLSWIHMGIYCTSTWVCLHV